MALPLDERPWKKVEKGFLAGESARSLGREFGVSDTAIRKRFGSITKQVKLVANQLATVEQVFYSLPIGSQIAARTLANELLEISSNLAGTARNGSATAKHLSNVANSIAVTIDKDNFDIEALKGVAALTQVVNESAKTGLTLLNINKDAMAEQERSANTQVYDEDLPPEDAYKRMING